MDSLLKRYGKRNVVQGGGALSSGRRFISTGPRDVQARNLCMRGCTFGVFQPKIDPAMGGEDREPDDSS